MMKKKTRNYQNEKVLEKGIDSLYKLRDVIIQKMGSTANQAHAHLGRLEQIRKDLIVLENLLADVNPKVPIKEDDTQIELKLNPVVQTEVKNEKPILAVEKESTVKSTAVKAKK